MADSDYARCKFSVTCFTHELAVVHCLRGLAAYAEQDCPRPITWGGTKAKDWKAAGNQVTFRFTSSKFRDDFEQHATLFLSKGSWNAVTRSDSDPAKRQRKK